MTSTFKRYRLAAVLLAMAMTILVPVLSTADTYIVPNGPLVPPGVSGMGPGSMDDSTATTTFDVSTNVTKAFSNGPPGASRSARNGRRLRGQQHRHRVF